MHFNGIKLVQKKEKQSNHSVKMDAHGNHPAENYHLYQLPSVFQSFIGIFFIEF